MTIKPEFRPGLEGVVAAQTRLSHVDGANGRLIIAEQRLEDLTRTHSFEQAAARLWSLATETPALDLDKALGRARLRVFEDLSPLWAALAAEGPKEGLKRGLAFLAEQDDLEDTAVTLTAGAGVLVAALARLDAGDTPLRPDPALGHAEDMLRMMHGAVPSPAAARALDVYLTGVSDHGLNASTFAARVVASTAAGLSWAALAGYCALTGPLHGGAPGPVLDMLDAIGTADNAEGWIADHLAQGERLMGFGHRIYRVRDPRADVFRAALETLRDDGPRLRLAEAVEQAALAALANAKPDRPLETNVEFYTALLLERLGIPRAAFTPVFAAGRIAGWIAHALEQQRTGRIIRPSSHYVGETP